MLMQLWRMPTQHVPSLPWTFLGAVEKSSRWPILPTSDQLWNILHQCGTHTLSATPTNRNGSTQVCPLCYWQLWSHQQCNFHAQLSKLANIGRKTAPIPPCCDVPHTSQPGGYPLAVLSHQNFILHKGSQLPTLCTVLQESFFPRTSKDWNNLTFDPADAPSLDIFTRKLRNDNA